MDSWKTLTGFLFILLLGVYNPSPAKELGLTRQLPGNIMAQFIDEYEKCAANFFYLATKEVRSFNREGYRNYKSKSGDAKAFAFNFRYDLLKRSGNTASYKEVYDRADKITHQKVKTHLEAIESRSPEGLDIISDKSTTRCQRALDNVCLFFWELGYACGRDGRRHE